MLPEDLSRLYAQNAMARTHGLLNSRFAIEIMFSKHKLSPF
jgi:hypothetical protein